MEYYILQVDSYDGDTTIREQFNSNARSEFSNVRALYSVVKITDQGAIIIDDGYRSRSEAKEAWPEAR
jgi:hypothetical protein